MIHLSEIPGGVEFQLWFLKTTMVGDRIKMLTAIGRGFEETGVDMVGKGYGGVGLQPAPFSDDMGTYFLAVRIADFLGTNLVETFFAIMLSLVAFGLVASIVLSWVAFSSLWARIYATIALVLLNIAAVFIAGDIYMVMAPATTVIGMFAIMLLRRQWTLNPGLLIAVCALGIVGGAFHLMRGHSATGALLFLAVVLALLMSASPIRRVLAVALLVLGFSLPMFYVQQIYAVRDTFLAENDPGYTPTYNQHPIWHVVYIGFGFLNNPYGLKFKDDVAYARARKTDPEYFRIGAPMSHLYSLKYETVMRQAVVEFFLEHPFFVVKTLFAKTGALTLYFLMFANLGVLFLLSRCRPWRLDAAIWPGILFSSLVGLTSMPNTNYILSYLALVVVYAIACVGWDVDNKGWRAIFIWQR